jgi:RNA 3'-terminal phosphate cyclase-like protein
MNHNVYSRAGDIQQQHQKIERKNMELPEDLGKRSAILLLQEIYSGGCIDTSAQSFALLMMCLSPEDVSRILMGQLSQYSIISLRLYKEAFGVEFKLRVKDKGESSDEGSDDGFGRKRGGGQTIICSCLGIGYRNMARAST